MRRVSAIEYPFECGCVFLRCDNKEEYEDKEPYIDTIVHPWVTCDKHKQQVKDNIVNFKEEEF